MHPYLTRLKIKPSVASFFEPYFTPTTAGDLIFPYSDCVEHFGLAFHRVPATDQFWLAGNLHFPQVRQVMVCASAMEAIAWLNNNYSSFSSPDNLLFLAVGSRLSPEHISFINHHLPGKSFGLLFGHDLLGRVADLKIAAGIRRIPVDVFFSQEEVVNVAFRSKLYAFPENEFSLPAFERTAKFRFKIPAYKPKSFDSFFAQLKANANLNS